MRAELVGGSGEKEIKKKGGKKRKKKKNLGLSLEIKKESCCFILAGVMNLLEPWAQNQVSSMAFTLNYTDKQDEMHRTES